jgi:hypothetical protein
MLHPPAIFARRRSLRSFWEGEAPRWVSVETIRRLFEMKGKDPAAYHDREGNNNEAAEDYFATVSVFQAA